MMNIRWAILPGIIFGSLCVYFLGNLIAGPDVVLAETEAVSAEDSIQVKEAQEKNTNSGSCSIPGSYSPAVREWCGLIEHYSREQGLEPNLIAALITQESGGDPQAYSKSGAVGLMQVMPRDGLAAGFMCVNGPCFAARPSMNELYDPEFNIAYGTNMLAGLVRKHGTIRDALKAYGPINMGYRYADIVLNIYESYR